MRANRTLRIVRFTCQGGRCGGYWSEEVGNGGESVGGGTGARFSVPYPFPFLISLENWGLFSSQNFLQKIIVADCSIFVVIW
jgi:hypothetical protein